MSGSTVRTVRCLLVWLVATALLSKTASMLAGGVLAAVEEVFFGDLGDQSFETLLVWLCSFAAAACCLWFWVTSTVVVLLAARGMTADHRHRVPGCPELIRRAVFILCGVAVAGSLAVPAQAARSGADAVGPDRTLAGLPLPERAVRQDAGANRTPPGQIVPIAHTEDDHGAERSRVRVQPGDSLWSIAAQALGPTASTAEVNHRWHEIYELNRAVIGADPDVIHPGQELRLNEA